MKDIIILGPPGSGKGTQAKYLAEKLKMYYFGMGDLMREEAAKKTEIGQEFQKTWNKGEGQLVPTEFTERFVAQKLKELELSRGIIFDGYPRNLSQAEMLEEFFQENTRDYLVINLECSVENLIKRMETRRVCGKCGKIFFRSQESMNRCDSCSGSLIQRQEDKPDTIRKRIEVYREQTEPLIVFYRGRGRMITVDGNPSIEAVQAEILGKLNGN